MASSVSSKRAFSSAGITLSKRRNCLQANIVKALQFLKCMFHNDLIFREVCSLVEEEIYSDLSDGLEGDIVEAIEVLWEELLIDSSDIPDSDDEA